MKKDRIKGLLLEQLKKIPIVQIACEKTGIARDTFYRWKIEDKEFAKAAVNAIAEGEMYITDLSETQLIGLIKDKNFPAINLWLRVHHQKYTDRVELSGSLTILDEDLTPEQATLVKEALRLASFDKKTKTNGH